MKKSIYIQTYGCQMNERDSEEALGMLVAQGYEITDKPEAADVILLNTCSVREHAEARAIGKMGELSELKKEKPDVVLGIIGCMAKLQQDLIFKRLPKVDLVAGPAELYDLPYLLAEIQEKRQKDPNFPKAARTMAVGRQFRPLDLKPEGEYRKPGITAFVTIMEGCDKACTYCIVPKTRGQEVSRPAEEIIAEINRLVEAGYKDITLLGQNVNSYGKRFPDGSGYKGPLGRLRLLEENPDALLDFPQLLRLINSEICQLSGAAQRPASESRAQRAGSERLLSRGHLSDRAPDGRGVGGRFAARRAPGASVRASGRCDSSAATSPVRIRFTTSHPFDATERLFAAIRDCESVCEYLHLPVQSGSNRILRAMRRGYTAENYLKKIEMLRREVPDISLSTDIIVGFPDETEDDFKATVRLLKEVRYENTYIFKYSPRPGTDAALKEDSVPLEVKEERNQALLALQAEIQQERYKAWEGRQVEILVEHEGHFEQQWFGRTRGNQGLVIEGVSEGPALVGQLVSATVTRGTAHTLFGKLEPCQKLSPLSGQQR